MSRAAGLPERAGVVTPYVERVARGIEAGAGRPAATLAEPSHESPRNGDSPPVPPVVVPAGQAAPVARVANRPGEVVGALTLLEPAAAGRGAWRVRCNVCRGERIVLNVSSVRARLKANPRAGACRACCNAASRLPRRCRACGTEEAARFGRKGATECMACQQKRRRRQAGRVATKTQRCRVCAVAGHFAPTCPNGVMVERVLAGAIRGVVAELEPLRPALRRVVVDRVMRSLFTLEAVDATGLIDRIVEHRDGRSPRGVRVGVADAK